MPVHVHWAFTAPFLKSGKQTEILPRLPVLCPQQQFPSGWLCHWRLKTEIICCCWLPCCWTSLHSGRCFCFSQATDSLMAPFLLPPGTSNHLLLSGEAEGTTYTITTLFFKFFLLGTPEWLNKADALQSCVVLKQLQSLSPYLWKRLSSCSATWFPNTPRCSHEDKKKVLKKISGWSQSSFSRHWCCCA